MNNEAILADAPREPGVRHCPNCATMRDIHPCHPGCADGTLLPSNVIPFPVKRLAAPPDQPAAVEPPEVDIPPNQGTPLDEHDQGMLVLALTYADAGWEVFPLSPGSTKAPRIRSPHPKGHRCKGECGKDGHGVNDATTDPATICRWWATQYPGCNIGLRLPPTLFVLDCDPRKPDHVPALQLLTGHGPLPHTLITVSGRRDGGLHRFYRKPSGELAGKLVVPGLEQFANEDGTPTHGLDVKGPGSYVVAPGSIHPDTGLPYVELDAPIAECPDWLTQFVIKPPRVKPVKLQGFFASSGGTWPRGVSPADWYTDNTSWSDVLDGWELLSGTGDDDGDTWRHPNATSATSATISNGGLLFVYSTSTAFEPTYPGNPHGYTKFAAYAELNHHGDQSAAAKAIREGGM